MREIDTYIELADESENIVDLGEATELTEGYEFTSVYEIATHDKRY
ncbi:hypothetical protein [Ramlibacter sp.]|nr:hypothetical protein [Ramlibacter sp.]MBA2672525.1 hypothetical protein [Ramlibacter sp.]